MILHSPAIKTHFHKKGCALGLILEVRVFGPRKWPNWLSSLDIQLLQDSTVFAQVLSKFLTSPMLEKTFLPYKNLQTLLNINFDSCKKCLNGLCKFKIVVGNSPGKFVFA